MSCVKAAGFFISLCVLGMLASATHGADPPPAVKQYTFELVTLNAGDKVRKGQTSFAGGAVEFKIAATMTEDELEFGQEHSRRLCSAPPDDAGYRDFSMSNGTRVRIGGFLVEDFPKIAVAGVHEPAGRVLSAG